MKKDFYCSTCGKQELDKNEIGVCKKLLGRKIEKFLCFQCLASYLDVTVEDVLEKVEQFKEQGCTLFV